MVCLSVAALVFLSGQAPAVAESPYECIGIGGAGGIFTPGASPADPDFMLCSCDMSGCYRSNDGGRSWRLIPFKQICSAIGCKPYFHPTNVNVAVWKDRVTRDKGWTWQPLAKGNAPWGGSQNVTHVACAGEAVLSVCIGTANGLWGNHDGGGSWKEMVSGKGACGGITILPDGTAYAAVGSALYRWVAGRSEPAPVGTEGVSGAIKAVAGGGRADAHVVHLVASGGVYTSTDSGRTWRQSQSNGGVADVVMATNQTSIAYSCDRKNVYVTKDGGATWTSTFKMYSNVELSWVQAEMRWDYYVISNGLNVCPGRAEMVMMTTQAELFVSHDAGGRWRHVINRRVGNAPGGPGGRYQGIGLEVTGSWDYFFDPNDPNRHYCGFSDFGFMRSVDRGKTWSWATRGCPWSNTFYDVAFDPFQKGKMYAATSRRHEVIHWICCTPTNMPGGVCVSEDYAVSWKPLSGLPQKPCCGVEIDRKASRPGALTMYATIWSEGVYKSTDSGKTWRKKPGVGRPGNYHAFQVRVHPKTSDVYVNVSANRQGSNFPVPGGIWKSSDGGDSWTEITAGLELSWLNGFAVHPENPQIAYLASAATPGSRGRQGGVYRTTDGGLHWKHVLTDGDMPGGYVHGLCVELHPDEPNVVYFGGSQGLWASPDGGEHWRQLDEIPFKVCHRVRIDPNDKKTMYVTTDGAGVIRGPVLRGMPGEKARIASAAPRPRTPKPEPPPPRAPAPLAPKGPTEEEIAAAERAETELKKAVIDGVAGGRKASVWVQLMGRPMRAKVVGADENGIQVSALGMETSIGWSSLSPRRFYGLVRKYVKDRDVLATYCRGKGLEEEAERELTH